MLKYTMDNVERAVAVDGTTLDMIADAIMREGQANGRHVVSFVVDGIDVFDDVTALDKRPDLVMSLVVTTMAIEEMASDAIANAQNYLHSVREMGAVTADLFRAGDDASGQASFRAFLDAVLIFVQTVEQLMAITTASKTPISADALLSGHSADLMKTLTTLQEAQAHNDPGFIADVLSHELLPLLSTWQNLLDDLKK